MKKAFVILTIAVFTHLFSQPTAIPPSAGDGSSGNPYQIETLENLYWIAADNANWDKSYIQTADINASETSTWFSDGSGGYFGWPPIGTESNVFSGSYYGQNFTISGLYINRPSEDYVGFIGYIDGGSVQLKKIKLISLNVLGGDYFTGGLAGSYYYSSTGSDPLVSGCYVSGSVNGGGYVGGLMGSVWEYVQIDSCFASVTINSPGADYTGGLIGYNYAGEISNSHSLGNIYGGDHTGGLVGYNEYASVSCSYSSCNITSSGNNAGGLIGYHQFGFISDCFADGDVTGETGFYIGGLIGYSYMNGEIIEICYSTGDVTGSSTLGGLIGYSEGGLIRENCCYGNVTGSGAVTGGFVGINRSEIINCYARGNADGNTYIGGFAGQNYNASSLITNCYSTGTVSGSTHLGGFTGVDDGVTNGSYWDIETSGISISASGTGKTTFEMKDASTYSGWDFGVWWISTYFWNYPSLIEINGIPIEPTYFPNNISTFFSNGNMEITWYPPPEPYFFRVYSCPDPYAAFPSAWTIEAEGFKERTWTDINASGLRKFYIITAYDGIK